MDTDFLSACFGVVCTGIALSACLFFITQCNVESKKSMDNLKAQQAINALEYRKACLEAGNIIIDDDCIKVVIGEEIRVGR